MVKNQNQGRADIVSNAFNSKKLSFINVLVGEIRRSKVYASCLDVLRKLATCTFWVRRFKNKIHCADVFKARKPQISYKEGI